MIKKKIHRLIEYMIAVFSMYKNKKYNKKDIDRSILIIITGVLGDSTLFMNDLQALYRTYVRTNGYHMTVVCISYMKELYCKYLDCPDIHYVCYDGSNQLMLKDYRQIIGTLRKRQYKECLHIHGDYIGRYISAAIVAENYYCLVKNYWQGKDKERHIERFIVDRLYQKGQYVIFDPRKFIKAMYRELLCLLELEITYEAADVEKSVRVEPDHIANPHNKNQYIILAPESSIAFKNIPAIYSINIIDYILLNTSYSIVITSNKTGSRYINDILKDYHDNPRVQDMTGTSLNDFTKLIAGSLFMIGSDSGHIHLAAYLGKNSICLTGYWDKGLFFPYDESCNTGEKAPICIYEAKEPACSYCGYNGGSKKNNGECYRNLLDGKAAKCLCQIKIDDVFKEIDCVLPDETA